MFKGLFKFLSGLIKLAFLLIILGVIFHTWVIKQAFTFSLSHQLGADVSIQSVKMDWKNTGFEVQGLEIGNPYSFPKGMLANIPLVIVSVDLASIPKGILRFKVVGFNLRELQVVKVPQKGLNLLALKPLQDQKDDETRPASPENGSGKTGKSTSQVMIDELIFSVGDINYLDMSGPSLKKNRFHAGIRGATYHNIRGAEDMVVIVITEALKKMGSDYLSSQIPKLQAKYIPSGVDQGGFLSRLLGIFEEGSSN